MTGAARAGKSRAQRRREKKSPRQPLFGKISRKLMAFMVGLIGLLLALVWVLNVYLLEMFYNLNIQNGLTHTAEELGAVVERAGQVEGPRSDGFSDAFAEAFLNGDYFDRLAGMCVEIADGSGRSVFKLHQLASGECLLHPTVRDAGFLNVDVTLWDNVNTLNYRLHTLEYGDSHFTLEDKPGGMRQMVVCHRTSNGYSVIVSTDLERIGQAGRVIAFQLPIIAAVLLVIGTLGAYAFSRWITKPLTELSAAAREMARGNYDVRVSPRSSDEIGVLAQDFNTMAGEVARANELQRDLLANVSHDLRTPLTLIKGYAETMRDINGGDEEKRNEQLDIIIDESDRLSSLVNSVMDLSKYSSGAVKPHKVRFDLAQMCDEVGSRYENICEQSGAHLVIEADEPCMVLADPDSMQRVIHNLLANAVHHVGEDGYLALRALSREGGGVRVEVEDHGAGIPKEDLPYIFDKYYRSRADAGKVGTGLGLSITKAILVSHGFAFGVRSEVGSGSVFWFEAPPAPAQPDAKQ